MVWLPAHFQFTNGGESVGLIPTRYPGSEKSDDHRVRLARRTEWTEASPEMFIGQGRQFSTDAGDYALMDIRSVTFGKRIGAGAADA